MFLRTALMLILGISLSGCQGLETLSKQELKPIDPTLQPAKSLEEILQMSSIQQVLQKFEVSGGHKAVAISENGFFGFAAQTNSVRWAEFIAMKDCSAQAGVYAEQTGKKIRGCFLYQVDDQVNTQRTNALSNAVKYSKVPQFYDLHLGNRVKQRFAQHQSRPENKAFAISPGGEWAEAYGFTYIDDAAKRAVNLCNASMDYLGDAMCHLYAINGQPVPR